MKLQLAGKRNGFWPNQGGKGRRSGYSWGRAQTSIRQKNRHQQPIPNGKIPFKQRENKTDPSNTLEGAPKKQV